MKLGVICDGLSRELKHALKIMDEFNLEYAELQYVGEKEVGDHTREEINEIKNVLDNFNNISILGLGFGNQRQLWLFNDIQIRIDEESEEGLVLTIVLKENYILGEIRYEGNKKIKDKKFDEEINLRSGMRIRPNLINETITEMKNLYADDGYLLVDIEAVVEEPKDLSENSDDKKNQTRHLVFNINENKKIKLRYIKFEGNEKFSSFRLRRQLKETKMQRWYLFWRYILIKENMKKIN